jgi:hypothetical protein
MAVGVAGLVRKRAIFSDVEARRPEILLWTTRRLIARVDTAITASNEPGARRASIPRATARARRVERLARPEITIVDERH